VNYSFEAIGLKIAAEQAFSMLRTGGTATIIGMIPLGQKIELNGFEFLGERKIQGSMMGGNRFRIDMPRYIDFYFAGKLHLDELISARLRLSEINDGMEALRKGEVARQVIEFGA
jgi:S-(hydroxymethyl)glutathione dehydrogenase/alcohol dehydrogenase